MRYRNFLKGLREAYEHSDGVKTLRLGRLDAAWFADIQRETAFIIENGGSSDVGAPDHVTHWTRPRGKVRQFSLFNTSGRSEDYQGDYGYRGNAAHKKLVFPQLKGLTRFAALFGDALRNLRLNGMGADAGLSAHEENSITPRAWGADYIVRFHLPVFTNDRSYIYLDDERFTYREGELYFFHHGCVHAAANFGADARYHLVLDCFLDRKLFRALFPGGENRDAGFEKATPEAAIMTGEPHTFPEFVCENGKTITTGIAYGRRAPTLVDFYRRNYPSLFPTATSS
jgi:hypothetical protein